MSDRSSKNTRSSSRTTNRTRNTSNTYSENLISSKSKMTLRTAHEEMKLDVGDELEGVYIALNKILENKSELELILQNLTRQGLDLKKLKEKVMNLMTKNKVECYDICVFLMGTMLNGTNFVKWMKRIPDSEIKIVIDKVIKGLEIKQKVGGAGDAITPSRMFLLFPYAAAKVLTIPGVKFMGYEEAPFKLFASTSAISYLYSDKNLSDEYRRAGAVLHYGLQWIFFSKVPDNKAQKQSFLIWVQDQRTFFEIQKNVIASSATIGHYRQYLVDFSIQEIEKFLLERLEINYKMCRGALF